MGAIVLNGQSTFDITAPIGCRVQGDELVLQFTLGEGYNHAIVLLRLNTQEAHHVTTTLNEGYTKLRRRKPRPR